MNIKVLVADGCALSRLATQLFLQAVGDFEVVGQTADGETAIKLAETLRPELVLIELSLETIDGLKVITEMKAKLPTVKIVVFTTWDEDSDMASAFSVGADGFCNLENSSDLIECISSIMVGDYWIPGKANRELTMPLTA